MLWRAGDRSAAEVLMRRHYPSVLRYFELNASWAADDLAQKTFMACVERASAVRDATAFRAYLMGIARRQLAMHQRELSRTGALDDFEESPQRTQLSTLVARNHEQTLVLRAMASLPRRPQLLLILFYWDGVRTPALAESYGVPESTVRTRIARAREQLRKRMQELSGRPGWGIADDERLPALLTSVVGATSVAAPTRSVEGVRGGSTGTR